MQLYSTFYQRNTKCSININSISSQCASKIAPYYFIYYIFAGSTQHRNDLFWNRNWSWFQTYDLTTSYPLHENPAAPRSTPAINFIQCSRGFMKRKIKISSLIICKLSQLFRSYNWYLLLYLQYVPSWKHMSDFMRAAVNVSQILRMHAIGLIIALAIWQYNTLLCTGVIYESHSSDFANRTVGLIFRSGFHFYIHNFAITVVVRRVICRKVIDCTLKSRHQMSIN